MDHELIISVTKTTAELADEIIDSSPRSYAYVTFLAGDGDYVKGVVCLAKGLRRVQAAYPLVVAVLPDVPEEHRNMLLNQGCLLREIDPVLPPVSNKESSFAREYFAVNYCKLRLWKFVEYRKMIYMDADIQVLGNIDNLFDLPSGCFYAVMDCLCEMDGHTCPEVVQWPQELGERPSFYLNCGMFLFEPCLDTYASLLSTLDVTPPTPFAEQDFLNLFFKDNAKPIHPVYNLLVAMLWRHPEYVELDIVKVVHFCVAGSKPWKYTGEGEYMDRADVKMLVDRWWEIYNDAALDFPGTGASSQVSG
ncbi:galactinol synthase 2-like isoform X2 [Salvia miltiorrhiza]|uniref:galactinol synthase 2-like isoform X2 n=1 Tax=Salvia miltiorrhiza TaxID=226208 RepID=UPI0025ACF190|nr:galactinol synthase 2-like isoform X2 [Salvia miltiorrhiza]